MKIERRLVAGTVSIRTEGAVRTIAGYAGVYNAEAVIAGRFRERVAPGAFRSVIGPTADVRGLFNHDANQVLGRTTAGTLRLSEDDKGLRYEIDPPNTSYANDLLESLTRGDVTESSYGFVVKRDEWTKPTRSGELPLRTIHEYEFLQDVSPVTFPAFEETTAEARAEAARATATGLSADDADEQAELIQYQALKAFLDQLTALIAQATPTVDALIADETESPTETDDEEAAEESIEQARLTVVLALTQQMCGAASGARSLAANCLTAYPYGYYSAATNATIRARLDLLEAEC